MQLTLTQIAPAVAEGQEAVKVFDGRGGRVGRGANNDWVLVDPARRLSKTHFTIAFDGEGFLLADQSTNGVYLNGSARRVPQDAKVRLSDGDIIRCADYQISVAIDGSAGAEDTSEDTFLGVLTTARPQPPAPAPVPAPPPPAPAADPFAGLDDDLAGLIHPPRPAPMPLPDPLAAFDDDGLGGFTTLPPPAAQPLDPFAGLGFPASEPDTGDDGLGGFISGPAAAILEDNSLFGALPAPADWGRPPQPDHLPAEHQAFTAPAPVQHIPDDWLSDETLMPAAPAPAPVRAVAPQPAPPPIPVPPPPAAASASDAVLAAFLKGAGLDQDGLKRPPEEAMYRAGRLFRLLVEGVRQELSSRAAVKSEFRLEQTYLRPAGNNPLKFSVSAEDAVRALLRDEPGSNLGSEQAIDQAFSDLQQHQMALLAGAQEAITGLLLRFHPDELDKAMGRSNGLLGIGGGGRARALEAYREMHARVVEEVQENFHESFGRNFARAYRRGNSKDD